MSKIVKRIEAYLQSNGIAVSKAETLINVSNGTLSKPIRDNKTIKTDTLEKFLSVFKDFTITDNKNYKIESEKLHIVSEPTQLPKLITVDSQGNENIVMVPIAAQAGYLNGFGDEDYITTLPTYRLPRIDNGSFRMFEVKGDSMIPTLHPGSIVVGEWVEDWSNIKDNQIYILITTHGIVVKRVINRIEKYGNIFLKSDNRSEYPSYPVLTSDLLEVWKVNLAMLYNLLDPSTLFDRINDLEADMAMLKTNKLS